MGSTTSGRGIAAIAVTGWALGGCLQVLGLGDYEEGAGGQGGNKTSTTASGTPSSTTPSSQSATGSAAGSTSASTGASTTNSSGDSGSGGAPPVCDSGTSQCVGSVPAGWTGPVALFSGATDPPLCIGDYPTPTQPFFADIDEGSAHCTCTCDPAQGIQCTTSAIACFSSATCGSICNTSSAVLAPGVCTSISANSLTNATVNNPPPTNVGSCAHHATSDIPTPTFATKARGCGGATVTSEGCGGTDLCAPLGPSGSLMCIERAGESTCDDPFYTEQHVFYDGATDGRSCSACDCGPASSTCGGSVDFSEAGCSIFLRTVPAGGCGPKNNGASANTAKYAPVPSGSCNPVPTSGQVLGSVTLGSPVTFCCH